MISKILHQIESFDSENFSNPAAQIANEWHPFSRSASIPAVKEHMKLFLANMQYNSEP